TATCSARSPRNGSPIRRTTSRSSRTCARWTTRSRNRSLGSCTTSLNMPSPGKTDLTAAIDGAGPSEGRRAADFLHEARERERAACLPEAIVCYQAAVTAAERGGEPTVLAEALRRLAVVQRHRSEAATARDLCQRSYEVARQAGNDLLAAEALNTLGGLHLSAGAPDDARRAFLEALELGGSSRELRARVEQNLGILANIQGELHEAIARYERSLDAYRDCRDEHGCAVLAESRLRSAIELAVAAGAVLGEAEASRELALLYQAMGRNQEALRLLNTASRLFQRMDARVDQVHVGGKLAELKGVYLD